MHMSLMLGIVLILFFTSLTLMCLYRRKMNVRTWNAVFVAIDVVFFFLWNYASYQKGWLDKRFMTLDNISPFTFTIIPLTYFMNKKTKEYAFSAISFLSVGMFVAMIFSPEHAYLFSYTADASFLYTTEALCHLLCSLYGVYLVLTDQVQANVPNLIKSVAFMYVVICFGVFLNYVFHKDFFGMDPYGNYRIYMLQLFGSFGATFTAYLLGVFVVLVSGMLGNGFLRSLMAEYERREDENATLATALYEGNEQTDEETTNE